MFPFSLLSSSIKLSDRLESLRDAESKLLEFAKSRFHHEQHNNNNNSGGGSVFELFDTPIQPPSVIKKHHSSDALSSCQVFDDTEHYSLHGVKVVKNTQQQSSSSQTTQQEEEPPAAPPLVLLHGYANGSLYFYRNLHGLSQFYGQVYALDLLGWGLSSRPKFDLLQKQDISDSSNKSNNSEEENRVKLAEQFFVESLESWRKSHNISKMTLAGHSMGGYLSVAYTERYPQHVDKLILLSPVGVPQKVDEEDEKRISAMPFYIRTMIHGVRTLFNQGITPGSFLRSLPYSKSRSMVESYIVNRLPSITCEHERSSLGEYLYQNSMLPGSGEYCLNEILTAGAFAKVPLIDRIPNLQSSSSSGGGMNDDGEGLEIHFVYGQNDWMDYRGGLDVQRLCHQKKALLSHSTQQQSSSPSPPTVFVHGVRSAGHLLMLENYQEFNAAMAIAAGKNEQELTRLGMSRPVEFVCNEVADARSESTAQFRSYSGKNVMRNEEDAAKFFRGGRWNRKQESPNKNSVQMADEGK